MRPLTRQRITPRDRSHIIISPLFLRSSRGGFTLYSLLRRLSARVTLLTLAFLLALWLGSITGSAWSTSHPCLSVPGSVITGVILGPKSLGPLGENRRDIACGLDGKVKWATIYISAEKVDKAEVTK